MDMMHWAYGEGAKIWDAAEALVRQQNVTWEEAFRRLDVDVSSFGPALLECVRHEMRERDSKYRVAQLVLNARHGN